LFLVLRSWLRSPEVVVDEWNYLHLAGIRASRSEAMSIAGGFNPRIG
jgi:hypothetical protein